MTGVAVSLGRGTGRYSWRAYYPTGELLAEGQLRFGEPVGRWTFYAPDGDVTLRARYVRGEWR